MKQTLLIVTLFIIYSFILLSCVGVQPPANSVTAPATKTPDLTEGEVKKSFFATADGSTPYPTKLKVNEPTVTPSPTFPLSKQDAIATALAYTGDKAPNLKIYNVTQYGTSGYAIRLHQVYQGILVEGADTLVNIEPNQEPRISSTFFLNIQLPSITPTITLSETIPTAVETLGIRGDYWIHRQARLMIVQVPAEEESKQFVLAWRVHISARCPSGDWFVDINAYTGDALGFGETSISENPDLRGGCPTPVPIHPTKIWTNPSPTPTPTPRLSEQGAIATAIAYLGDKAPNLVLQRVYGEYPSYTLYFQQTYHNIPIYESQISISVRFEKPTTDKGIYFSELQLPSITPTITLEEAIPIAAEALALQENYLSNHKTKLVVYPVPAEEEEKGFILAWEVHLLGFCPTGFWLANINAYTGEVLYHGYNDTTKFEPDECPTPPPVPLPTKIPASRP